VGALWGSNQKGTRNFCLKGKVLGSRLRGNDRIRKENGKKLQVVAEYR